MKRGGVTPKPLPTGWVFCNRHHGDGFTIRWRRGDSTADVLQGNNVGSGTKEGLIGTIQVPIKGWADLAQIRLRGENWARSK